MTKKYRDLDLHPISQDTFLAIACDSCGGIGLKPLDNVKAPPQVVARLTTRVVLMEVLSTGAIPAALTAAICCEPEPTGEALLEGIRQSMAEAGYPDLPLTISTEKNVPTQQTALGMTAIGMLQNKTLEMRRSRPGCHVFAAGIPKVGQELADDESQVADFTTLRQLLDSPEVIEIWPAGSRGILAEGRDLATAAGGRLNLSLNNTTSLDLHKSAGTCTTLLFTSDQSSLDLTRFNVPCYAIGMIGYIGTNDSDGSINF